MDSIEFHPWSILFHNHNFNFTFSIMALTWVKWRHIVVKRITRMWVDWFHLMVKWVKYYLFYSLIQSINEMCFYSMLTIVLLSIQIMHISSIQNSSLRFLHNVNAFDIRQSLCGVNVLSVPVNWISSNGPSHFQFSMFFQQTQK